VDRDQQLKAAAAWTNTSGIEHAILHLLYALLVKGHADLGTVTVDGDPSPAAGQGMVLNETFTDGQRAENRKYF
jgi:leucyl-tRNA synthetase